MKRVVLTFIAFLFITGLAVSKENEYSIPLIGSECPSFTANSTHGKINFPQDYGKSWKILFSHPQDFTPVCTTELLEMAYLSPVFKKLDVEVVAISTVDNVEQHKKWVEFLEEVDYKERGSQKVTFPIVEDVKGLISKKFGMFHPPASSNRDVRGVYIIDPDNIVRSINFYPMEIGRNMKEIVRIVQALQQTDEYSVYTPANWEEGDDIIIPYRPFPLLELETNPERIKRDYYSLKGHIWFKRVNQLEAN